VVKFAISSGLVVVCVFAAAAADAGGRHGKASVCEDAGLIGAAYAACNVYCEALDCDGDDPRGSGRACQQALSRFQDLEEGALPPCVEAEIPQCPCSAAWNTEGFFPETPTFVECMAEGDGVNIRHLHLLLADDATGSSGWASLDFFNSEDIEAPFDWIACFTEHQPLNPGDPETGGFEMSNYFHPVPAAFEQLQGQIYSACEADLRRIIEDLGVECDGIDRAAN
jgi:hypothetical protein